MSYLGNMPKGDPAKPYTPPVEGGSATDQTPFPTSGVVATASREKQDTGGGDLVGSPMPPPSPLQWLNELGLALFFLSHPVPRFPTHLATHIMCQLGPGGNGLFR